MSSTRWRTVRNWVLVPMLIVGVGSTLVTSAGAQAVPGGQGTDTSLPLTDSAVTVTGRDQFSDLRITVNQTANLTNQAVSISWEGGTKTRRGPGQFAAHFLQIMQCWGDPDDSVPDNPGPPPEQCVGGASTATFAGVGGGVVPAGNATRRTISKDNWENYDPDVGFTEPRTGQVWREFRAVNGDVVGTHVNPDYNPQIGGIFWTNPYFNLVTTNEVSAAVTRSDGTGIELFQTLTGLESTGLGCGQRVQAVEGAEPKIPQCWIVVVPRGTPVDENVGTPSGGDRADVFGVSTSPLSEEAWKNRIAIPIEFNPVDTPCSIADVERRIAGNDLILQAVARWQPKLCEGGDLPPYSYAPVADSTARQLLSNPTSGSPGMVLVGRPLDPAFVADDNPVVYAPVSLSGLVVGFNVERIFTLDAPEAAQDDLTGIRIADINLTPRLVAKLLTQSYAEQVRINGSEPRYDWLGGQPSYLGADPDFVQFNPEFELLRIGDRRTFSGLQVPAGNSDAARTVWEWILADAEASAWMSGEPDEWGMVVNPAFSTNSATNPAGVDFADPIPESFPKADPYCYQAPPLELDKSVLPPLLCGTDWQPYARNFEETAVRARRGFDGAKIAQDIFARRAIDVWERIEPQFVGRRSMISLTDSPNASLLGLQVAKLSRAGDNGADRVFVAPDSAGLLAGLASMSPGGEPQVLEPTPADQLEGAYPLTALTYAASAPLAIDDQAREEYAAFIDYAIGAGQQPGFRPGELPLGYEPLPAELRAQAVLASAALRELEAPAEPPPTTVPSTSTVPPTAAPTTTSTTTPTSTTAPVSSTTFSSPTPIPGFPPTGVPAPGGGSGGDVGSAGDGAAAATTTSTTSTTEPPTTTIPATSSPTTQPEPAPTTTAVQPPTPGLDVGAGRIAVPLLGGLAIASALAALELTKRPRRSLGHDSIHFDPPGTSTGPTPEDI